LVGIERLWDFGDEMQLENVEIVMQLLSEKISERKLEAKICERASL
jgi:hypothetical protein